MPVILRIARSHEVISQKRNEQAHGSSKNRSEADRTQAKVELLGLMDIDECANPENPGDQWTGATGDFRRSGKSVMVE